jgi:hypothetical protein
MFGPDKGIMPQVILLHDVLPVCVGASSVSITTGATAIAVRPAANEYGGSRGVQPINGKREAERGRQANQTTGCARPGLA